MRSSGLGDGSSSKVRVLWAGVDPPDPPPAALDVVCEPSVAVAARLAQTEPFDAVVVDGGDPASVSAVLAAAASNDRVRRRLVASTYTQLPGLVRDVDARLIERVLAKPVSRAQLAHAVIDADPSESVI
ncbi:MAG: hypothetical protein KDK70_33035, partial [Myxococcales bacterium]|nr:hypothetical protein [Myxococcales bacterium]